MALLLAFLIGILTGLRSFTAPAVTAWAACLGWLRLQRPLALIGSGLAVGILTSIAVIELVADKLPKTPSRTAPSGLIARFVMGGLSGACVAAGGGSRPIVGAILGAAGGIAGAFSGYRIRTGLVRALAKPDIYVALLEDAVAIGGCLLVVSRY